MENKKHKKLMLSAIIFPALILLTAATLPLLGACEGAIIPKAVSTAEDLFSMKKGGSYRLTNDIDLQNAVWTPLPIRAFNGNGFTIKNCQINGVYPPSTSESFTTYTAFFGQANTIKDVIFENISVTTTGAYRIAVVVGELNKSAKNVTVKDCTINGLVSAGDCKMGFLCGYSDANFSDCTVSNCTLNCSLTGSSSAYTSAYYGFGFGGICGSLESLASVSNCATTYCDVTINISGSKMIANIGGIAGQAEGFAKRDDKLMLQGCSATNNEFHIETKNGSDRATRIGGIVGFNGNADLSEDSKKQTNSVVSKCKSFANTFEVDAEYNYSLGGIAGRNNGKLENNLSDTNSFHASSSHSSATAMLGGICGSSTYGSIRSCIAQNCDLHGTSGAGDDIHTCGLAGDCGASISYCAVRNNSVSGAGSDAFMSESNMIFNCCIYAEAASNVNDITICSDEEWMRIMSTLSLDQTIWEQVAGGDLNLKINQE